MSGKLGRAKCGHVGEAVVGNYYECLEGCDQPDFDEITLELECSHQEVHVMHGPWTDTYWCAACGARVWDLFNRTLVKL